MKLQLLQFVVVSMFLVSICVIASVVVGSDKSTSPFQGYTIGVIALIAYMGSFALSKK